MLFVQRGGLWSMNPDGTGVRPIVSRKGWQCVSVAADATGKTLVFAAIEEKSTGDTVERLCCVRADGTRLTTLQSCPTDDWTAFESPAFVKGGTAIAYVRHGSGTGEASLRSFALKERRERTVYGFGKDAAFYDCYLPSVAPDGRRLACVSIGYVAPGVRGGDQSRRGVVVITSEGRDARLVRADPRVTGALAWSPDGRYIAYSTGDSLCVLDSQIGTARVLLSQRYVGQPVWRPAGGLLSSVDTRPAPGVPSTGRRAARVEVVPVQCPYDDCEQRARHGRVLIWFSDGVTETADAVGEEFSPALVAPDGKTIGWLKGEHFEYHGRRACWPTKLILYTPGRSRVVVAGKYAFVEEWFFWADGRQVALKSRLAHGPCYDELHDARTGRLISVVYGPGVNGRSPAWARKLGY
jgi:hypothetical protein